MMAVSMLLKSWAMPPARCPMASIFWAWRSCSSLSLSAASALLRSVMSSAARTMPTGKILFLADE